MGSRRSTKSGFPGVSIFARANGALYATWRNVRTKKKEYVSLKKLGYSTVAEARETLREIAIRLQLERRELLLGMQSITPEQKQLEERRKTPVLQVMDGYFQDYAAKHGERSVKDQRRRLRPFIEWINEQHGGKLACGAISTVALNDFAIHVRSLKAKRAVKGPRGAVAETERSLMASSINDYRGATVAFLNWARRAGYLVLHRDEIGESLPKTKVPRQLRTVLTSEQLQKLIDCAVTLDLTRCHGSRSDKHAYYSGEQSELARQKYAPVAPLLILLLLTGMRLQEVMHLRWESISLDDDRLLVRRDRATGWDVKTRNERLIPLGDSPCLRHFLSHLRTRCGEAEYVIQGHCKSRPRPFDKRAWQRLLEKAGIGKFTAKDLRSAFASHLGAARGGPTPWELALRMGHTVEVAAQHYIASVRPKEGRSVEQWLGVESALWEAFDRLGMPKLQVVKVESNTMPAIAG